MPYSITRAFPTDNDLGGSNQGRVYQDKTHDQLWGPYPFSTGSRFGGCNFVKQGFDWDTVAGSLTATFNAGIAVIDGRVYECTGSESVLCAADGANLVYLQVTEDGSNRPTGLTLIVTNTSTEPPERAVFLAEVTTGPTTITRVVENPPNSAFGTSGLYTGDDQPGRTIWLGYRPKFMILGNSSNQVDAYAGGLLVDVGKIQLSNLGFQPVDTPGNNAIGNTYRFEAFWGPSLP